MENKITNQLWMLCAKYHAVMLNICVWKVDTLLDIVWREYSLPRTDGQDAGHYVAVDDDNNSREAKTALLLEELKIIYEQLEEEGLSMDMARQMLWESEQVSRLMVRENCIIALPDLDITLKMTPLQWAIYIFFLKHDEGIILKNINNYRNEIISLLTLAHREKYCSGLINEQRITAMYERLCDPSGCGIKEVISKIRHTFSKALNSECRARHYYVSGHRGREYGIPLSRQFVHFLLPT